MSDLRVCMRNFLCDKLFDWAFGDDEDYLDKNLLQASDEIESKITPRATAPRLALAPSRVLSRTSAPTTNQTHLLPVPLQDPPIFALSKHHRDSTEITLALQKLNPCY